MVLLIFNPSARTLRRAVCKIMGALNPRQFDLPSLDAVQQVQFSPTCLMSELTAVRDMPQGITAFDAFAIKLAGQRWVVGFEFSYRPLGGDINAPDVRSGTFEAIYSREGRCESVQHFNTALKKFKGLRYERCADAPSPWDGVASE